MNDINPLENLEKNLKDIQNVIKYNGIEIEHNLNNTGVKQITLMLPDVAPYHNSAIN